MSGIYIASKSCHGPRWVELRSKGLAICSTWIDESGQGETVDWSDFWVRCVKEAAEADALVLYAEEGEVLKGALVEMGAALAHGRPVYYVGPCDLLSALKHPAVFHMADLDGALSAAGRVVQMVAQMNREQALLGQERWTRGRDY